MTETFDRTKNLDQHYMRQVLNLARRGIGHVNPNPLVGALLIKNGEIIGSGWHKRYGEPHAERNAIVSCSVSPRDSVLYVNLEPCCHTGKTPPCTDAIIESGISSVVIGTRDPNPLIAGKGIEILKNHGIEVIEDVLSDECTELNKIFFHYIRTKLPYVILKYAMTMDGRIASRTGESKWITGEPARERVHLERNRCAAVMVGIGTVLADDPMLDCRIEGGRNPLRIICDTHLRTPLDSNIVKTARVIPTLIATASPDYEKHKVYREKGCNINVYQQTDGRLNLSELLKRLGRDGVDSILIEGGGELNYSALASGMVNEIKCYVAPRILGGKDARSPVEGFGFVNPDRSLRLKNTRITQIGADFLLESEVDKCLPEL